MAASAASATVTASARYSMLQRARNTVLRQARTAATLTIPGLVPAQGASDPHDIATQPWQSLGARGVNNVASKLLLSLFPQTPFFRLDIDPKTASDMGTNLGPAQDALSQISYLAMTLAEVSGSRPLWMEAFRHLIVAGNILVFHPDDGTPMRVWRLDQYVVRRDAQGRLIEAVIEEDVYPSELAPEVRAACNIPDDSEPDDQGHPSGKDETKIQLYTVVERVGDNIVHYQEINDIEVPGSRGSAKSDVAGWQALRWQAVPGSDYGRSMVSEYAGDFLSLEEGWKAVIQFAAEAARIVTIVDPNSGLDVEELAEAETGDHLTGFIEKIQKLGLDKSADFGVLWNILQSIERRLSQAFLLTANTIRDAERVTAEEIRAVAQELEDSFGGTYTVLSSEAQAPYARRLLYILSKQGKAPKLPDNVVPMVVTGFAALGQNHEAQAIMDWVDSLVGVFGQQWGMQNLNGQEIAFRTGTGRGIPDVKGMVLDQQTVAQNTADQQNSELGMAVAPEIAKGAMNAMQNPANLQRAQEAMNGSQ